MLFAAGNFLIAVQILLHLIGDLTPKIEPIQPVKMIEPLNQSPMQTGVPYSVPPVAGPKR